jgi:uncharacterized membrane protein YfcA
LEIEYLLFVLLGFFASIVSSVFGFGTALIVLAIGPYLLPVKQTIALATVLFVASTATKTALFRNHMDWKVVGTMAVASLPFSYFGASLVVDLPADLLKRLLGGMILVYLLLSVFKRFPKFRIGTSGLLVGSAAYGFVSGLLGSGNLIKAIMFREMNITREVFVGVMAATSVLSNVAKLVAYTRAELLHAGLAWPMLGLVCGAVIVAIVGRRLLGKLNASQFEKGFQLVLAVSATGLLI